MNLLTQDEAIDAMNAFVKSFNNEIPPGMYILVSREIAQHISDYSMSFTGNVKTMYSGDEFFYKGHKCKVA